MKIPFYKQPWFAAISIVLAFVMILSFSVNALWQSTFGQINRLNAKANTNIKDSDINVLEKEISKNPISYDKEITNILVLGIDSRDPDEINTRSDTIMILTVNQKQKKLKLTSLQRDMLVPLPDTDEMDKLTHANVYGGPEYMIQTINDILRLDIDRYVVVNMRNLEKIIDKLDGIEIDVPEEAYGFLDPIIDEQNNVFSDTPASPYVTKSGLQVLNGRQSVAYARNRSTAGSDYDRMGYQREVVQAMLTKFLDVNLTQKLEVVKEGMSCVTTNLSETEILGMMQSVLPIVDEEIETLTVPIEGYNTEYSGEVWLNLCDFNGMIPLIQEFIYGKTFDFDPVPEIPGAPNSSSEIDDVPVDEWVTNPEYYEEYYGPTEYYEPTQYYDPNQNLPLETTYDAPNYYPTENVTDPVITDPLPTEAPAIENTVADQPMDGPVY